MDMLGIENGTVSGEAGDEQHIWNTVKLDDQWYHVDVTWDDPIGSSLNTQIILTLILQLKTCLLTIHGTMTNTVNMRIAERNILM